MTSLLHPLALLFTLLSLSSNPLRSADFPKSSRLTESTIRELNPEFIFKLSSTKVGLIGTCQQGDKYIYKLISFDLSSKKFDERQVDILHNEFPCMTNFSIVSTGKLLISKVNHLNTGTKFDFYLFDSNTSKMHKISRSYNKCNTFCLYSLKTSDNEILISSFTRSEPIFCFSPKTNTIRSVKLDSLPAFARNKYTVTYIPSGKILISGGTGRDDIYPSELIDLKNFSTIRTSQKLFPHNNHSSLCINDHQAILVGGNNNKKIEIFDSTTGLYTEFCTMERARPNKTNCMQLDNGEILIAGGENFKRNSTDLNIYNNQTIELINPKTKQTRSLPFENKLSFFTKIEDPLFLKLSSNEIMITTNQFDYYFIFNAQLNTLTQMAIQFSERSPMRPNPPLNSDAASTRHRPRRSFRFPVSFSNFAIGRAG